MSTRFGSHNNTKCKQFHSTHSNGTEHEIRDQKNLYLELAENEHVNESIKINKNINPMKNY